MSHCKGSRHEPTSRMEGHKGLVLNVAMTSLNVAVEYAHTHPILFSFKRHRHTLGGFFLQVGVSKNNGTPKWMVYNL